MVRNGKEAHQRPLMRLYALTDDISKAGNEADLTATEQRIDDILKEELERQVTGDAKAGRPLLWDWQRTASNT